MPTKRTKTIQITNYRAYAGKYPPIQLPNAENLLIYGENGSGKSSLFKAFNNYLTASINTRLPFVKNRYFEHDEGEIKITFSDFNTGAFKIIPGTAQSFYFGSDSSNNNINFIKDAALIKGFLDYTNLLDVYLHKVPNPNLFELIVLKLLGEHVPISSGGNFKFGTKWKNLQKDLIERSYTRNDIFHKRAKSELPIFEAHLRATLDEVFSKVNYFLYTYFKDLDIEIHYQLKKLEFNYGNSKWDWFTSADLRLLISKDGQRIRGDYRDVLNEARMSAFAICLYLASLKCNPTMLDFKILYLDDIFIGLDSGNRIPILDIIIKEFEDYQIFLSTYDRFTFEFAKRHFETNALGKWKTIELYVAKETNPTNFDKPIIINEINEFAQGIHYLHHTHKPDYPAAANYFRKYAEKIITEFLPPHEARNDDYEMLQGWELGKLVNATIKFLNKINRNTPLMGQLKNELPTILHPLSHFNLSSPVYKKELFLIQNNLLALAEYFKTLKDNFKMLIPQSKILKVRFPIGTQDDGYYEIFCEEMLYLVNNPGQQATLSTGRCRLKSTYRITNTISTKPHLFNKNDIQYHYKSINEAYEKLHSYIIGLPGFAAIPKAVNPFTEFEIDVNGANQILNNLLVWQ